MTWRIQVVSWQLWTSTRHRASGQVGTVTAIGYRISLQGWPDLVHGVSGGDPVSGRGAAVEFVVGQIAEPAARPVLSNAGAWGALDEIRAP